MLQTTSLLLSLLPLALSAPAPAPNPASLNPIQISKFNFQPSNIAFTFNDPNTQIKTTCTATSIPTIYTPCKNPNVSFKFPPGDKASAFHISLKETSTSSDAYIVGFASKEVVAKKAPKKFDLPIQSVYPFQPFQLPGISTFSPSGRPGSSPYATLNFTVTDVNGNGKATTTCSTQWISGQQPPSGDLPCADTSFVFRVTEFQGVGQFTLGLSHSYALEAGATGPKITTTGDVTVDNLAEDPNYRCVFGGSGVGSCGIAEGKAPLKAPITKVVGL